MLHVKKYLLILLLSCVLNSACGQWQDANNGLYGGLVTRVGSARGLLFAGTDGGGMHLSDDNALSWKLANEELGEGYIVASTTFDDTLYVSNTGVERVLFYDFENGSWTAVNAGLDNAKAITALCHTSKYVFAQDNQGSIFRLASGQWTPLDPGITGVKWTCATPDYVFLTTENNVYRSGDEGYTWEEVYSGPDINFLTAHGDLVMISPLFGSAIISSNGGFSWHVTTGLEDAFGVLHRASTAIITTDEGIYRSTGNWTAWTRVADVSAEWGITSNDEVIIVGGYHGIYRSNDDGNTWILSNFNLKNAYIRCSASNNNKMMVGTDLGIYRSEDMGETWKYVDELPFGRTSALMCNGETCLVSFPDHGVYLSKNFGETWQYSLDQRLVSSFALYKDKYYGGGATGLFSSGDGLNWTQILTTYNYAFIFFKDELYMSASAAGIIRKSADLGKTWTEVSTGIFPGAWASFFHVYKDKLFVGTNVALYRLDQSSWTLLGVDNSNPISMASNTAAMYCGTQGSIYKSTNLGDDWMPMNEGLPTLQYEYITNLLATDAHLFAGTEAHGLLRWGPCFTPATPQIVNQGDTLLIANEENGLQWYLDGNILPGAVNDSLKVTVRGNYSVLVLIDECQSELSEDIKAGPIAQPVLEMPNVFTRNDDAFNPTFAAMRMEGIGRAVMRIFDRSGDEIFVTTNLVEGWNGGEFPAGVYYYKIDYAAESGANGDVKGYVHLLR